jgi:hypothetical protein
MRKLGWIVGAGVLCTMGACDDGSEEGVREAFDAYVSALERHDGDALAAAIDPENVKHYDQVVEVARNGSKETVMRLPPHQRFTVVLLRAKFSKEKLDKLDGLGFVKMGMEQAPQDESGRAAKISLGPIKVSKPRASAEMVLNGEGTTLRFEFVEVEHKWLVNDECLDEWEDRLIRKLATMLQTSEDVIIIKMASGAVGKEVHMAIFDAPPK